MSFAFEVLGIVNHKKVGIVNNYTRLNLKYFIPRLLYYAVY
jgi:hypothetical protein